MRAVPYLKLIVLTLLFAVGGCVSAPANDNYAGLRRVAIVSDLPPLPQYTVIGTTVFNNKYGAAQLPSAPEFAEVYLGKRLQSIGYTVVEEPATADMLVTLRAGVIHYREKSEGYGFLGRRFLGMDAWLVSYAALKLTIQSAGGMHCEVCYGKSETKLKVTDIHQNWNQFAVTEQQMLETAMFRDIASAVDKALKRAKIW